MHFVLALVIAQSANAPACDSPAWCLDEAAAAERQNNLEAAKEFRARARALEVLLHAQERAQAAKKPIPTAPPIVAAPEEIAPEAAIEPPAPLPVTEDVEPQVEVQSEVKPEVKSEAVDPGPPTRVGFAITGGLEVGPQLQTQAWQARGRMGAGVRVSLLARNPQGAELETLPTVTFLAGYAGRLVDAADHRVFGEGRFELLVARPRGMLGPAFTAYLISGVDVLVGGPLLGAQPYFGAGVGWDANPFNGPSKPSLGNGLGSLAGGLFRGIGGGGGAGAAAAIAIVPVVLIAAAVVAVAIVTYVCAGRFEVRYAPWASRGSQPTVSMLIGYGF